MKYAFWAFGFIMIGLFGLFFILLFQDVTINNEAEYYVLKEAMSASMLESVDFACYRIGEDCKSPTDLKMSEQKFVENFTRRFAKSISGTVQNYTIEFYDIMEKPPKASVVIKGKTKRFGILSSGDEDVTFDLTNNLSGILEINPSVCEFTDYYFFIIHIYKGGNVWNTGKACNTADFLYQTLNVDSSNVEKTFEEVKIVRNETGLASNEMSLTDFYKYYRNTLSDNVCDANNGFYCSSSSMNTRYFIHGRWTTEGCFETPEDNEPVVDYPVEDDINNDKEKSIFFKKEIDELVDMSVLPIDVGITYDNASNRYFSDCSIDIADYDVEFGNLKCDEAVANGKIKDYKYMLTNFKIERTFAQSNEESIRFFGSFNKDYLLSPALYKITYNICGNNK